MDKYRYDIQSLLSDIALTPEREQNLRQICFDVFTRRFENSPQGLSLQCKLRLQTEGRSGVEVYCVSFHPIADDHTIVATKIIKYREGAQACKDANYEFEVASSVVFKSDFFISPK